MNLEYEHDPAEGYVVDAIKKLHRSMSTTRVHNPLAAVVAPVRLIAAALLVLVSLVSLGGCQGEASEQRPSDRERQPPRPRAQLAPVPPLPVPGDPIYPEYYATLPLEDTRMHLAGAIHELLRARTRLVALDEEKYAAWIASADGDIRVLVKLMCATRIELADVDIEHARIEDMFPLRYVETAREFVCVGFRLERRTVENDLWEPRVIRLQREAARDAGGDDDARP